MKDSRKLISFGKSSYVISLPKSWIKRNNLKKGDAVNMIEKAGGLVLSANATEEKEKSKEVAINVDGKHLAEIRREIIAAYIDGFNTISVVGKSMNKKADGIKNILHGLMALEILEETKNKIVAKDFIDASKIQLNEMIRKMDIMTLAIIIDSRQILEGKKISVENLYHRDDDVNRLNYLLLRILKHCLISPFLSKIHNLSVLDILCLWNVVSCIEAIADESKRVAKYLKKVKLGKKERRNLHHIYSKIEDFYRSVMKGFHLKDKQIIVKLANKKEELIEICKHCQKKINNPKTISAIEKMKNMIITINEIGRTLSNIYS